MFLAQDGSGIGKMRMASGSHDTPGDGHAVNTTSSQCFERDYVAGTITVLVRRWFR